MEDKTLVRGNIPALILNRKSYIDEFKWITPYLILDDTKETFTNTVGDRTFLIETLGDWPKGPLHYPRMVYFYTGLQHRDSGNDSGGINPASTEPGQVLLDLQETFGFRNFPNFWFRATFGANFVESPLGEVQIEGAPFIPSVTESYFVPKTLAIFVVTDNAFNTGLIDESTAETNLAINQAALLDSIEKFGSAWGNHAEIQIYTSLYDSFEHPEVSGPNNELLRGYYSGVSGTNVSYKGDAPLSASFFDTLIRSHFDLS